ncbi:flavin reductase family protein [candidate division KSB1 bacterium]|nr:flavin reductase family protein [candidate division KSB1 bacterium]
MSDSRTFFDTISLFATGVTVVTIQGDGQPHGMTANAFTSLSANPMQIIVCVAKKAKLNAYLAANVRFTVNVLRDDQEAISNQFAGATREQQGAEFRFIEWEGGPRIEGCLAAIGCELLALHDGGDHWIVVGKVLALLQGVEPRKPLLYFNRRYHRLEPDSTAAPGRSDLDGASEQMFYDPW